jgi:hypothetical protein
LPGLRSDGGAENQYRLCQAVAIGRLLLGNHSRAGTCGTELEGHRGPLHRTASRIGDLNHHRVVQRLANPAALPVAIDDRDRRRLALPWKDDPLSTPATGQKCGK